MAVVIETTVGDITVDLFLQERPKACLNFLKLCKLKYYNYNLFHTIEHGFIAQTGDPSGSGKEGLSIWGVVEGLHKQFFEAEYLPKIRHTEPGLISMVSTGKNMIGSQFFFTLGTDLTSLDGIHCVIGQISEGHDVLRKINEVICDDNHKPYQDIRITHTIVLEDPFEDPRGFRQPSRSPSPNPIRFQNGRIAADELIDDTEGKTGAEIHEMLAEREAKARATILEIVGDLPDAEIAPPENVLFVCKLNPVTTDDDLEIIFNRFGKIKSCEVIRDKLTGDSLQYAFVEFENKKSCEDAFFKMDNVLIDDRRIHVDFSQSIAKVKWIGKGRGVVYQNEDDVNKKLNFTNDSTHIFRNKDNRHQLIENQRKRSPKGPTRNRRNKRNCNEPLIKKNRTISQSPNRNRMYESPNTSTYQHKNKDCKQSRSNSQHRSRSHDHSKHDSEKSKKNRSTYKY